MKITIFGATGGIGHFIVEQAIKDGHEVTAYLRTQEINKYNWENVKIVNGELTDYSAIKNAVAGSDVVISALAVQMKFTYKEMISAIGHQNIIKAMEELNVKRLISWATPSITSNEDSKSFITVVPSIMAGIALPKAKKELTIITNTITQSNLDWIIVRFIAPKNTEFTGKIKTTFGKDKINFNISRADIAYFMYQQISDNKYLKRMPIIGS